MVQYYVGVAEQCYGLCMIYQRGLCMSYQHLWRGGIIHSRPRTSLREFVSGLFAWCVERVVCRDRKERFERVVS